MKDISHRMTEPGKCPTAPQVEGWVGKDANKFWQRVTQMIEKNYPDVFIPEWLFGGKKHGWSLRYKRGKSFCTLIPEKNRFAIQIVFGAEERAKVETIRNGLSVQTQRAYDGATTYHDGKWLVLTVNAERVVNDVERLLSVKRKSKSKK